MSISRTHAAALVGVEGFLVEVEATITSGVPGLHLVGLPEVGLGETRDRVRAAIINSDLSWPNRHVTVSLLPASLPKRGSGYDLAIAVAVLAAQDAIHRDACAGAVFIAELGLDGSLRPVPGVVPAVLAAVHAGYSTVVVAAANAAETATVPGVSVVAADHLTDIVLWLRGGPVPQHAGATTDAEQPPNVTPPQVGPDLADLPDVPVMRQALEASAAGGHHLQIVGRHGARDTGQALVPLLPDLTDEAALQVTAIHSAAALVSPRTPLITRPPYRCPSPTISPAQLCGSLGTTAQPGEMTLAHHGVLHLDEAPQFQSGVLDALRQPLEDGEVAVERAGRAVRYPARFTLLVTMAPCPCGASSDRDCTCEPIVVHRYQARLGGPILDRIDIKVRLPDSQPADVIHPPPRQATTSASVAERVATARDRAARRLANTPWATNAQIPTAELRRRFQPSRQAIAPLETAMRTGLVSARGAAQVVRLAWTLADLAGHDTPTAADVTAALDLNRPAG